MELGLYEDLRYFDFIDDDYVISGAFVLLDAAKQARRIRDVILQMGRNRRLDLSDPQWANKAFPMAVGSEWARLWAHASYPAARSVFSALADAHRAEVYRALCEQKILYMRDDVHDDVVGTLRAYLGNDLQLSSSCSDAPQRFLRAMCWLMDPQAEPARNEHFHAITIAAESTAPALARLVRPFCWGGSFQSGPALREAERLFDPKTIRAALWRNGLCRAPVGISPADEPPETGRVRSAAPGPTVPRSSLDRVIDKVTNANHTTLEPKDMIHMAQTQSPLSTAFDTIKKATIHGTKVAAADEAANLMLELASTLFPVQAAFLSDSENGRIALKYMTASTLITFIDYGVVPIEGAEGIRRAAELVLEATARDGVQPMLAKITPILTKLAAQGRNLVVTTEG